MQNENTRHPRLSKKTKDKLFVALKIIISLSILYIIFRKIGISSFHSELSNLRALPILLAVLLTIPSMWIRALRWGEVIKSAKESVPFEILLRLSYIALTFGLATPGRIGEFIKVHHLKKMAGISFRKSLYTAILDKFFDIYVICILSVLGFYFILGKDARLLLIFLVLLASSMFFYVPYNMMLGIAPHIKLLRNFSGNMPDYKLNFRSSIFISSLSYVIWLSLALQAFIILRMFGVTNLGFAEAVGIVSLMAFSSFIPVTIGGLGLKEGLAIILLSGSGVAAEKSVIFSLMYTLVNYAVIIPVGLYLLWKK